MPHFVSAVLWLVLSPLAVACDVITVLVLIHYCPFYHGTDILLFSAMIAMSINTLFIPPIPAILEIANIKWNSNLCQFYVWSFITFRVLQILTVLCMTVMWSSILKAATKGKRINFTGIIKGVVPTIWIASGVVGLLPIIGAVPDTYHSGNTCFFMSSGLGPGFSIFIGILIVTCMVVSLICSCDVMMLLNYVRRVALVKYGAGRFYLPKKKSEVPGSGTYTTHERYHQLTFAWDLSRLALVWTLVSFMVNHLPYTVVEFISLVAINSSRSDMEEVVVWLVLVEALCLPNILWCVSRRYRHALVYSWKVHVLKHPAEEEEDSPSCTLRSYYKHHQNGVPRGPGSAGVQIASITNSLADGNSLDRRVHPHTPERMFPSTSMTEEARRQLQQQQANSHRNGRLDRYPSIENSNRQQQHEKVVIESRPSSVAKSRDSPLTVLSSGSPTQKYHFPDEPEALARTASSRREWKEQMRKKHLPPIFVNEAFDADEANRLRRHRNHHSSVEVEGSVDGVHHVREESASQQSLHFYMSGDYHHDNLNTDSLPRKKHILQHKRSESEGLTGQYDEADIEKILDTSSVRSAETMYRTGIKHMSSFHAPADEENKYRKKYSTDVNDSDDNDDATVSQQNLPDVITDGVTSFVDYRNTLETVPIEEPRNVDDAKGELSCSGSPAVTMNTIEEVEYSLSYIDPRQTEEEEESLDVFKTDLEPYGEFHVKLPRTSVTSEQRNSSISVSSFEDEIRFPPLHKKDSSTPNDNRWERFTNTHGSNLGPYYRSRNFESPNSNMSTPVSFTFDEDTDRGFEEALSVGYPDTSSIYSGTPGAPSGSVSEDPDVSVSNPFQECDASFEEDNFRTCAVVSTKSVDSRSTTSSENPFDSLPPLRTESKGVLATNSSSREKGEYSPTSDITVNSTTEAEYGDSGFNSGLDSALPVSRDVNSSPWPLSEETRKSVDMCFESNFSSNDSLNQNESVNVSMDIHSEYSQKEYIPTSKPLTAKDVDPVYF